MEREAANARYARLHDDRKWHDGSFTQWAKEPSREFPYRFDFGVTVGVADTDLRPHDLFTTREAAPFEEQDTGVAPGELAGPGQ